MKITKTVLQRLYTSHPHSIALLQAFTPLLQAQNSLAEEFSETIELPSLDAAAFAQGKSWIQAEDIPLSDAFLKKAVKKLAGAAGKGLPELKDALKESESFLAKNLDLAEDLARLRLQGKMKQIPAWAKKHAQHVNVSTLLAMQLAGAAARTFRAKAETASLPAWDKGYCPLCGSRPQAGLIRRIEGVRSLLCSLCAHEWRFSRTTCPVCEQNKPDHLTLVHLEGSLHERAEGCIDCKHYVLSLDMRKMADDTPVELFLLCMMPLDLIMHEKGFIPAAGDQ